MAPTSQPGIIGKLLNTISPRIGVGGKDAGSGPMDRIARLGLSQRQQELNRLWSWYRCSPYAARQTDWNGKKALEPLEMEAVASKGFIPPGFYDAGGQSMPLKFRRPTAPYALAKVVVDRFTGLLFSENQSPEILVDGDDASADYLRAVAEVARLWQAMIRVRTFGGATGSACIGFQFVDGKPVVEVHDPRWVHPKFIDRATMQLESVEKRYMHPVEERDPATGRFETKQMWYRRIIDGERDVVFKPVEVGNGEEPQWEVEREVQHGFGFCPVVWVQNLPVEDDIDGDPDCHGIFDLIEAVDALVAQANRGIIANCDPTLVIVSKAEMGGEIKKGSDNSIKMPEGSASYLELNASGPKAALELAEQLRKYALEVAQCVLEHPDVSGGARTATEVTRSYGSMLQKADVMREQYGERCVKPLLEMIFRAAQALDQPVQGTDAQGQPVMVRRALQLPPRFEADPETGVKTRVERQLGAGGTIRLQWPDYFPPTLADIDSAVKAATGAKTGGLVDEETAISFVAPFFSVDDVAGMIKKIRDSAAASQASMFGGIPGMDGGGGEELDDGYSPEESEFLYDEQPEE